MPAKKPCIEAGCELPKYGTKHRCVWHLLTTLSPDEQFNASVSRLERAQRRDGYRHRPRVPKEQWPHGRRWCSGCQAFVPQFYTSGSRCKGCASMASYLSHVKRTYGMEPDDYLALLAWQGNRCYVCGATGRSRRLALDHDHDTSLPRGLLCADKDWGCNVTLRLVLNDAARARRILEYVELSPVQRMTAGQPPLAW